MTKYNCCYKPCYKPCYDPCKPKCCDPCKKTNLLIIAKTLTSVDTSTLTTSPVAGTYTTPLYTQSLIPYSNYHYNPGYSPYGSGIITVVSGGTSLTIHYTQSVNNHYNHYNQYNQCGYYNYGYNYTAALSMPQSIPIAPITFTDSGGNKFVLILSSVPGASSLTYTANGGTAQAVSITVTTSFLYNTILYTITSGP